MNHTGIREEDTLFYYIFVIPHLKLTVVVVVLVVVEMVEVVRGLDSSTQVASKPIQLPPSTHFFFM